MDSRNLVVLLEDEPIIRKGFKDLFEDLNINLSLHCCATPDEYEDFLGDKLNRSRLRVLIMDLANTLVEENMGAEKVMEYAATKFIQQEYLENRIPIFIHSSKLQYFKNLDNKGTVWKIEKSSDSAEKICEKIQLLLDSDFLNIFCFGGKLETKIMDELHSAFISQFKENEIEGIIKSIKSTNNQNEKERVSEVFERIAIRSLYENLVSTKKLDGKLTDIKFNAFEHYYRRTSEYHIWTGDIFKSKTGDTTVVVLTPRCNVGHENYDQLLLCKLLDLKGNKLEEILSKKRGKDNLKRNITDDVTLTKERFRFLPRTPQFSGGVVDYKTLFTKTEIDFLEHYNRVISLSDELTNDVVRKLNAYLSRGGISETEFNEAHYYVTSTEDPKNKFK